MLYAIMYFFFTPLFLYIYLMLIFSHFTFDNDGMKSSKRQVTFILLIFLLKKHLTVFLFLSQLENRHPQKADIDMAGLCTRLIPTRRLRSTKFLAILTIGLTAFFTNLYVLKFFTTAKQTPKIIRENIAGEVRMVQPSASHLKTTSIIQRKNFTTTTTPPKKSVTSNPDLKSSFAENSNKSCAHRIREMDGGIVLFRDIIIRPKLGRARVLEIHLEHPAEEDEFFKLQKGFFTLFCDGDVNEAKEKLHIVKKYNALTAWILALEVANPLLSQLLRSNQSFQTGHYLAIERWEYANVYWTVIDLLDIFITTQRMGIEPEKLSIILMDAHPPTPLDPFWSVLFQGLIKLTDPIFTESNNVVFENLVWRYPRVNCPLLDKNLKSLKYIQPFRSFVLKRFGIPSGAHIRNCSQQTINVLVNFRRDYQSHPRNLDGTVDRKIANEKDIVKEMVEGNFSSKLNITTVQLDLFPLKRQLELVASADIFFGMHGSAHGFPIFMAPGGVVIEMFNFNSGNWHMGKIASLSGHSHVIWTNTDRNAYNKKTRSTTIPAGVPSMLLRKALEKICDQKINIEKNKS